MFLFSTSFSLSVFAKAPCLTNYLGANLFNYSPFDNYLLIFFFFMIFDVRDIGGRNRRKRGMKKCECRMVERYITRLKKWKLKTKIYVQFFSLSRFYFHSFIFILSCFPYILPTWSQTLKQNGNYYKKSPLCSPNSYNHLSE